MTDIDRTASLRAAESRLQAAQLTSDVEVLTELLDDRVLFTAPDGGLHTKQDDLGAHRSGQQVMSRVDQEDLRVLVSGDTGVTWFLGTLEAAIGGGPPQTARMRYTRTWVHDDGTGWRIVAAHASMLGAGSR